MTKQDKAELAIQREIKAIHKYAEKYKCCISEAAYDVLTDGPCTRALAQLVCERLGIWDGSLGPWNLRLVNRKWSSIAEVASYYSETYGDYKQRR